MATTKMTVTSVWTEQKQNTGWALEDPVNLLLPTYTDLDILEFWYQEHEIISRQKPHLCYVQLNMRSLSIASTWIRAPENP